MTKRLAIDGRARHGGRRFFSSIAVSWIACFGAACAMPPAARDTGSLAIVLVEERGVIPETVRVLVDGHPVGHVSEGVPLLNLEPGRHRVRAEADGCEAGDVDVEIVGHGGRQMVRLALRPLRVRAVEGTASDRLYIPLTVERLRRAPDRFDGEDVAIEGSYVVGFETSVLDDLLWVTPLECETVSPPEPEPDDEYARHRVKIYGRLTTGEMRGHLGEYPYEIMPHVIVFFGQEKP